jgi:hypothetical protein
MKTLVFFLEEPSAREMLKGLVPRLLPDNVHTQYVVFEGKQDLEKRLPIRLRAWQVPDSLFVVMRDQDSGDCIAIKSGLVQKCANAGKPDTLVRIACRELESFYLADLAAVAATIGPATLPELQNKQRYRTPDVIQNPATELKKIAPAYQKISGSRAIGKHLDLDNHRSHSFGLLVSGIRALLNR